MKEACARILSDVRTNDSDPVERFVRVLRKPGDSVQKQKAGSGILFISRAATRDLFRYASPIPDNTCANECCTSTFGGFSSPQISTSGYWKTAKPDAQTTAHDRLDRTYGNSVRPMRHLVDSPDEVSFLEVRPEPINVGNVED